MPKCNKDAQIVRRIRTRRMLHGHLEVERGDWRLENEAKVRTREEGELQGGGVDGEKEKEQTLW